MPVCVIIRPNPDDEEIISNSTQTTVDIEQEFIFHYFATVNRMKEVMHEAKIEMRLDTYFRLLKRMTDLITIPFEGEPLSGLQVMGVLETRALDFDRLIILSMNEGIFPRRNLPTRLFHITCAVDLVCLRMNIRTACGLIISTD